MGGDDSSDNNDTTNQTTEDITSEGISTEAPSENAEATNTEEQTPTESDVITYSSGMYKVGTDIPAGEYLVESDGQEYIEVATDSTGELDSIVTNAMYNNRMYITVSDGQYLTFGGTATPVSEAEAFQTENGYYPEGQYLVGKDIPAGEYKISVLENSVTGFGYVEVASDSVGTLNSIITNSNIETDTYQSVTDGQYLTLSGCEIKGQ